MIGLFNNEEINDLENLGRVPESFVYYLTLYLPSLLRAVKAAATVGRPDLLDLNTDLGEWGVLWPEGIQPSTFFCLRVLELESWVHISNCHSSHLPRNSLKLLKALSGVLCID